MKRTSLIIGACAIGAAIGVGAAATNVVFAEVQEERESASGGISGLMGAVRDSQRDRSRDELRPFDRVLHNDGNADLGRRYLSLEAEAGAGETTTIHYYVASGRHDMDIRTMTYWGDGAEGAIYFLDQPELDGSSFLPDMQAIFRYTDELRSTTVHFDPPMRIREGDAIVAVVVNDQSTTRGFGLINLQATVPVDVGGDVMVIE